MDSTTLTQACETIQAVVDQIEAEITELDPTVCDIDSAIEVQDLIDEAHLLRRAKECLEGRNAQLRTTEPHPDHRP